MIEAADQSTNFRGKTMSGRLVSTRVRRVAWVVFAAATLYACQTAFGAEWESDARLQRARELAHNGDYRDALDVYDDIVLDRDSSSRVVAGSLDEMFSYCFRLGEHRRGEELFAKVADLWQEDWRVLYALVSPSSIRFAANGSDDSRGASSSGRLLPFRNRAIRMLLEAERLYDAGSAPADSTEKTMVHSALAMWLMMGREGQCAWQLTALTNLDQPGESADDETPYWMRFRRYAPVDAEGKPLYYRVPASWEGAASDGERWRWTLERMAAAGGEEGRALADLRLAAFLLEQFGVQTLSRDGSLAGDMGKEAGPFAVRTLADTETIARLANGPKRFVMPDEFNHIAILRRVASSGYAPAKGAAICMLARIFENRQQYSKAVACWKWAIQCGVPETGMLFSHLSLYHPEVDRVREQSPTESLSRLIGNAGAFEIGPTASAGEVTTLSYVYRNGDRVVLTARKLDERQFFHDVLNSEAGGAMGMYQTLADRIDADGMEKYVVGLVAEWSVALDPLPGHYSRRASIALPFTDAGCYLVEAAMRDGNTCRMVVWIPDLVLVKRDMGTKALFFVADAGTGELVVDATITFSNKSFRRVADEYGELKWTVCDDRFAERTDANGFVVVDSEHSGGLAVAETDDGRLAHMYTGSGGPGLNQLKSPAIFLISDRPVYRPGQEVKFKAWLGNGNYLEEKTPVAGRVLTVTVDNPNGESVYQGRFITDEFGGVDGTVRFESDAMLGRYHLKAATEDGERVIMDELGFLLDGYRKPEFAVEVETPDAAVTLGDTVRIAVKARYYYGAPVSKATVRYRIMRTDFTNSWTPSWRWDWLYGRGAWMGGYEYSWLTGCSSWGRPWRSSQPELIADGEGRLDADGVFRVPLDTAAAKEFLGDRDHVYAVTAEVTDDSRRIIVGSGRIVASRQPFSVQVWTDDEYHAAGGEVRTSIRATLPFGGGVEAAGTATLYRIRYDDAGAPVESVHSTQHIVTGRNGLGTLRLSLDEPGQYRLACGLDSGDGKVIEGSALLTIRGKPGEGEFRFNELELIPDKRDYAPGETVHLAVNSENDNALVLLFIRGGEEREAGIPVHDQRIIPLRLRNGSGQVDIPVWRADQPNFFCEAVTVYAGKVRHDRREIFVPPADRTLVVEVIPDKQSYAPGERASFTVKATDAAGAPVSGQCVVSVYDKSLEYISGGLNVEDICSRFWGWKRRSFFATWDSLKKPKPVARTWRGWDDRWMPIGVFGSREVDWNSEHEYPAPWPQYPAKRETITRRVLRSPGVYEYVTETVTVRPSANFQVPVPGEVAMPKTPDRLSRDSNTDGTSALTAMVAPALRSDFADAAVWEAALALDENGVASFSFDMPENLTAWRVRAWVMGEGTRVGSWGSEVVTKKNVIVRPQVPRFLTQTDRAVLSANLHNYLPRGKSARAELILEGGLLELAHGQEPVRMVELAANGEARVDWIVDALRPGEARIVMKLLTDEESDAAEVLLPIVIHGARTVDPFGGVIRPGEREAVVRFRVPEKRMADRSRLELSFSSSIASAMLDALPYLLEYPYGCTEQTLNRFLPAVMTGKFLSGMGVNLADAKHRLAVARTDAQSAAWRKTWGDPRANRGNLPVFDDGELERIVKQGIARLSSMQNADGGWGWFSGPEERSWPHTTAVVVHGLMTARDNGAAIPMGMLDAGLDWLRAYQAEQVAGLKAAPDAGKKETRVWRKAFADDLDAFVHMILARDGESEMRGFLYRDRLKLSQTGLVMFGLGLHRLNAGGELAVVLKNLEQYLRTDPAAGTAWLQTSAADWWRWHNDRIETQAWYLKLLARVDPKGDAASGIAKYLLQNRKNASYWRSTRDTAYAVEALAEYATASGESRPDGVVAVFLDGREVMRRTLAPETALDENMFILEGLAVEEGEHEVRIVREGAGNIYYGGGLDVFSLEDFIPASGQDVRVRRTFHKIEPVEKTLLVPTASGAASVGRAEAFRRLPLDTAGGAVVASGDLVEVELTITAANEYEYLVFEDRKAAGLEPVEIRSGYSGDALGAYVEYRDQKVTLFVRQLPRGTHTIRYRFRAEAPGRFSSLPVFGGGMYATELFANSDEAKIAVHEAGVFEE